MLHVHGRHPLGKDFQGYALSPEASAEIGLGDEHLYAEMARPLDKRQIVPMISFPDVDDEAIAVYREWLAKSDRVQY